MILPTLNSNHEKPAESLAVSHPEAEESLAAEPAPDHTSCRLQIIRLVNQIESRQERQIVGAVFQDLLRLLECLSLIESHLRQVDAAAETFALFQLIHDEARILVDFIREDGLECVAMNEDLADALDGITFALNHDLQRVFEPAPHAASFESHSEIAELQSEIAELKSQASNAATNSSRQSSSPNPHVVLGKLYRAHDLLTNCLQQSTITLAMMFDPELVGARLFNNSDMRYRQSLQLCEDLSTLIQLVETAEKETGEPALASLKTGIEEFRAESMECLMYSDWPQFESFCERLKVGATSTTALEPVLNQFRCYLETLLGQVRMRAVLANVSPVQFGAGENSSASDFQRQQSSWDMFAVAV